jgi:hypothetical protein
MEIKTSTLESGSTIQQIRNELEQLAYSDRGFQEVITLVWALPDQFWVRVCKRLIATIIVGIQPDYHNPGVPPSE